jgi:hypothetical protein
MSFKVSHLFEKKNLHQVVYIPYLSIKKKCTIRLLSTFRDHNKMSSNNNQKNMNKKKSFGVREPLPER